MTFHGNMVVSNHAALKHASVVMSYQPLPVVELVDLLAVNQSEASLECLAWIISNFDLLVTPVSRRNEDPPRVSSTTTTIPMNFASLIPNSPITQPWHWRGIGLGVVDAIGVSNVSLHRMAGRSWLRVCLLLLNLFFFFLETELLAAALVAAFGFAVVATALAAAFGVSVFSANLPPVLG